MGRVLVVGGSGFIGRAVQRYVLNRGMGSSFTFTYNRSQEKVFPGLDRIRLDLLSDSYDTDLGSYSTAIYLAGNSDHGLAKRDPSLDLKLNAGAFLNFSSQFNGSLVMLSSQAVYFGLRGMIDENVDHVPAIPYGLSKRAQEAYASYFLKDGKLSDLWIFRLMYAFGEGEKERRLISLCAKAAAGGDKVKIFGDGRSYINPLPSSFVAEVLVSASLGLKNEGFRFTEITNINHPEVITVGDAVRFLSGLRSFDYSIEASGEEWPVTFWGKTERLSGHLNTWKLKFPDPWKSLKRYYLKKIDEVRE